MERSANDNPAFDHADLERALELVKRVVVGERATVELGAEEMATYCRRLSSVLPVMERWGLLVVQRGHDGGSTGAVLTEAGVDLGNRLDEGDIALFPAKGGIRIVAAPTSRTPASAVAEPGDAVVVDALTEIMAVAPRHYGIDVMQDTATAVLIDPLDRWDDYPNLFRANYEMADLQRVWEVFSRCGKSFGFVVQTARGFFGIDALGGSRHEGSLAAAAWQISVNR